LSLSAFTSGINVRPIKTLEGHGDGAVYDVRWKGGIMISGGEDGNVAVWQIGEEDVEEAAE